MTLVLAEVELRIRLGTGLICDTLLEQLNASWLASYRTTFRWNSQQHGQGTRSTFGPLQGVNRLEICKDKSAPSGRAVSWDYRMEA